MNQSYLKASIDGPNGSGKSGTAVRMSVGISKELCNSAPVMAIDSEERWRFYKPVIFDVERVPLIIVPGRALVDVQRGLQIAEKEGCCVVVDDQLTTPWMEGVRAFSRENGLLSFDLRQQLMNQWEPVVQGFRYGAFHSIFCGRMGYFWENVEDEDGNEQLHQGDTKFNAGGGQNFGYEADLELEMRRRKRKILGLFRGKTSIEHICDVVKDAASGILNGRQFTWPSTQGLYQLGDYRTVFDSFRPYLEFMQRVPAVIPPSSSTKELIVSGKTAWAKDQSNRKALLEEIDVNLNMAFPSGEGKSKQAAMFRNLTLERFNGYASWSRMEEETPTEILLRNLNYFKAIRARVEAGQLPIDQVSLKVLLDQATKDVVSPGSSMTLLEAMGERSVAEITNRKRGPQPIVKTLDREAQDEVAGD